MSFLKRFLCPEDRWLLGVGLAVAVSFASGVGLMAFRYNDEILYGEQRLAYAMSCATALQVLGITNHQDDAVILHTRTPKQELFGEFYSPGGNVRARYRS